MSPERDQIPWWNLRQPRPTQDLGWARMSSQPSLDGPGWSQFPKESETFVSAYSYWAQAGQRPGPECPTLAHNSLCGSLAVAKPVCVVKTQVLHGQKEKSGDKGYSLCRCQPSLWSWSVLWSPHDPASAPGSDPPLWMLCVESAETKVSMKKCRTITAMARGWTWASKLARTHRPDACGPGLLVPWETGQGGLGSASECFLISAIQAGPHSREKLVKIWGSGRMWSKAEHLWNPGIVHVYTCHSSPLGEWEKLRKYSHQDAWRMTSDTNTVSCYPGQSCGERGTRACWSTPPPRTPDHPNHLWEAQRGPHTTQNCMPDLGPINDAPRACVTGIVAITAAGLPELCLGLVAESHPLQRSPELQWEGVIKKWHPPPRRRRTTGANVSWTHPDPTRAQRLQPKRPSWFPAVYLPASDLAHSGHGKAPRDPSRRWGAGKIWEGSCQEGHRLTRWFSGRGMRRCCPEHAGGFLLLSGLRNFAGAWTAWNVKLKPQKYSYKTCMNNFYSVISEWSPCKAFISQSRTIK